jgi:hypothetical protein
VKACFLQCHTHSLQIISQELREIFSVIAVGVIIKFLHHRVLLVELGLDLSYYFSISTFINAIIFANFMFLMRI